MPIYIQKERHHDQAVRTRRYSEERAEWYDSLRHAFLNYCDRLTQSDGRMWAPGAFEVKGFAGIEHFRAEGLKVIDVNRDFWHDAAARGEDDPFIEFRGAMAQSIDPDMTLEQLQTAMGMGQSRVA